MTDSQHSSDEKNHELAKEHARERDEQKKRHRMLGAFLSFYLNLPLPLKIVFMVFGVLYSPAMVQNLAACVNAEKTGRLRVISGPEFMYFYMAGAWGMILCIIDYFMVKAGHTSPPMTWLYIGLLLFTFVTVGLDFKGGSWFGVIVVLFALMAILAWYVERENIAMLAIFGNFFEFFGIKSFPRQFVFAMSSGILVIYAIVWIRMNLHHVLKIEGNYVQVWNFAARSPKDTRASFSLVPDFDDINEVILGFSCRLNLRSKSRRIASHEFANMPGGPVVERIATSLLNAQEVEVMRDRFDDQFDTSDDDDE